MADALQLSVETIVAVALIVGSFMYIYDILMRRFLVDVLLAVFVFGGGLIYLFSLVYGKGNK
jgi:hypothetical protein